MADIPRSAGMTRRIVQFLAVLLTAICLVPSGAHLAALPAKIALAEAPYLTVQQIYAGWSLFGVVELGALLANLAMAVLEHGRPRAFRCALAATALLGLNLAIFFIWTWPANQATANWTIAPADWMALRVRWEYSHAANAVLVLLALCSALAGALATNVAPDAKRTAAS